MFLYLFFYVFEVLFIEQLIIDMVLQYRKRNVGRWRDYPGKKKIVGNPEDYEFRLLSHDRKKKIVESGSYETVLRRMRQVEFFKRKRGQKRLRLGAFDFY